MERTPHNQEIQTERNAHQKQQQQPGYIDTHSDLDPVLNEEIEAQPDDLQQQETESKINDIADSLLSYIAKINRHESRIPKEIRENPSHFSHLIYKVPVSVRRVNPECYTPRLVSLGPIHYNSPSLKSMEDLKYRYFQDFLNREPKETDKARKCASFIVDMEWHIRREYNEEIKLNSKEFCKMILLDSVFIVELLLKKQEKDHIFKNRWWFRDLLHDILLIENQIPFFVPNEIFIRFCSYNYSFSHLVTALTKDVNPKNVSGFDAFPTHFIEYLRAAYFNEKNSVSDVTMIRHAAVIRASRFILLYAEKYVAVTASRLLEYGVKFEKGQTTSLVDISFDSIKGILTIPQVKVNEWSENLFRNIVAYEQCNLGIEKKVSDYLIFMDGLIDTLEDVKILIEAKIIQDDLQDPKKVCHMFNNLHKEAIIEGRHYHFTEQSYELNKYRKNCWHRWTAKWYNWKLILKRDYFNSPWSITAFITAAMLLGLTIFQTICSFYQAKGIQMK